MNDLSSSFWFMVSMSFVWILTGVFCWFFLIKPEKMSTKNSKYNKTAKKSLHLSQDESTKVDVEAAE